VTASPLGSPCGAVFHQDGVPAYRRLKLLGNGSQGTAYLVEDLRTGEEFVLKRIFMPSAPPVGKQLEAATLCSLDHPAVVRYYDSWFDEVSSAFMILMEHVPGETLKDLLRSSNAGGSRARVSESEILDWVAQLLLALEHMHDKQVLHRDIKASNVLVTPERTLKLIDFGASRTLESADILASTVIGTPFYLAPEMIEGRGYGPRADVWAVGVLAYEIAMGVVPFHADNLPALALKIVGCRYAPLSPDYSQELKAVIARCLEGDPARRPTARELLRMPALVHRAASFVAASQGAVGRSSPVPAPWREASVDTLDLRAHHVPGSAGASARPANRAAVMAAWQVPAADADASSAEPIGVWADTAVRPPGAASWPRRLQPISSSDSVPDLQLSLAPTGAAHPSPDVTRSVSPKRRSEAGCAVDVASGEALADALSQLRAAAGATDDCTAARICALAARALSLTDVDLTDLPSDVVAAMCAALARNAQLCATVVTIDVSGTSCLAEEEEGWEDLAALVSACPGLQTLRAARLPAVSGACVAAVIAAAGANARVVSLDLDLSSNGLGARAEDAATLAAAFSACAAPTLGSVDLRGNRFNARAACAVLRALHSQPLKRVNLDGSVCLGDGSGRGSPSRLSAETTTSEPAPAPAPAIRRFSSFAGGLGALRGRSRTLDGSVPRAAGLRPRLSVPQLFRNTRNSSPHPPPPPPTSAAGAADEVASLTAQLAALLAAAPTLESVSLGREAHEPPSLDASYTVPDPRSPLWAVRLGLSPGGVRGLRRVQSLASAISAHCALRELCLGALPLTGAEARHVRVACGESHVWLVL